MVDGYKEEFLPRLEKNGLYMALVARCSRMEGNTMTIQDPDVLDLVQSGVSYACQRTKTIIRHMGEYTLHDADHLFRVLELMEKLMSKENIDLLSAPELMLLILTAFFHDIGMAPDEKEVINWRRVWDKTIPFFEDEQQEESFYKFKRFCLTNQSEQQELLELHAETETSDGIDDSVEKGAFSQAETFKGYLLSEFIRQTHGKRARDIIASDNIFGDKRSNKLMFREEDLTVEFANLCASHSEDAVKLLDLEKKQLCAPNTFACLPLVGVILRLADILDFDAKRTPAVLYSHLNVKHPVSLKEWQKHRSVGAWQISPELIQFSAKCGHPAIEAAIREFCDSIDRELSICNNIITAVNDFNTVEQRAIRIKLPFKVDRTKIQAKRDIHNNPYYLYRDTKFSLSKRQVIDLLMGTKLYGNAEVALRELLQNSIDACLLRKAQEKKWNVNDYTPEITVRYHSEGDDQVLEVIDNGTGMDQSIIDNYYTKIGSSFYTSVDFNKIMIESNADMKPTSRFGIGILSCFMVADTLIVDTMRILGPQKSSDAINMRVEGQESIFWIKPGERQSVGTTTKLVLRKSKNPWDKMSEEDFIASVENVIPNPPFNIIIQTESQKRSRNEASFQAMKAGSYVDYTWAGNENVRIIQFSFKNKDISGSCVVAMLEHQNMPVTEVDIHAKDVTIDGEIYPLYKKFRLSENQIILESTSIGTNVQSLITTNKSTEWLNRSISRISLHGIEVPADLFPESWKQKRNQVKLTWPFPSILVVDVGGSKDLDLNSARSEILVSEKWTLFEEELTFLVCSGIIKSVGEAYWNVYREKIINTAANQPLLRGAQQAHEVAFEGCEILDAFQIEILPFSKETVPENNLPF